MVSGENNLDTLPKILLINSPRTYYKKSKGVRVGLPLGIMYIAAVLENYGYRPKIFDSLIHPETKITSNGEVIFHGVSDETIQNTIKQGKPDVVGISCLYTAQIDNAIKLANLIKQVDKKILIVIGGPHASVLGEQLLKENLSLDIAVRGEGEYTFLEIINSFKDKKSLDSIKNIFYRNGSGKICQTESSDFISDLDALPYPAYHLVDIKLYFNMIGQGLKTRPSGQKRSISFITSRGCPYNCVFCSIHLHMGKLWRGHSAEYVVNHIEYVVNKFKVRHISFEDDNFTLNMKRAKEILQNIIKRKIKITWDTPNGVRADRLDEELCELMRKSGCIGLIFGVESGDQEVLSKIIGKNLNLGSVIKTAEICKRGKIKSQAFFMIGLPGEKIGNINKSLNFALMLRAKYGMRPNLSIATPLIGTKMHDLCKEKNYLVKDPDPKSLSLATQINGEGLIRTEDFTPDQIKEISLEFYRKIAKIDLLDKLKNPVFYFQFLMSLLIHPLETLKKFAKVFSIFKS